RQIGADGDCGEVDGRQVTYGKRPVSHNTEHKNPEHHQRCGNRPANKEPGDIHDSPPSCAFAFVFPARSFFRSFVSVVFASWLVSLISTLESAFNKNCPSRTICSPA